ncbi:hypothetical protein SM11_pC1423 (plasmid) [Sinorhizobium meliloti SM11]|uniref:Uncharacterized protein n=1 Tax=Sinorhizobium meliloti (strain SM11) TaxID=707241 RepID=F7XBH8_SINMM|nr:hypothetical protein SM11_pC1423 [Sinorhizobium meliloti SM11]
MTTENWRDSVAPNSAKTSEMKKQGRQKTDDK